MSTTTGTDTGAGKTVARKSGGPTFIPTSGARRTKAQIARILVTLCFAIAVVPLLWVLIEVIVKGVGAVGMVGRYCACERSEHGTGSRRQGRSGDRRK